jgi:hypothetical protein
VLTIKDITLDDEAEFTCKATNDLGTVTTFVDIFVESKQRDCLYQLGYNVVAMCVEPVYSEV